MARVLRPKWWILHLLVAVAVYVMLRLGLWQWHRAQAGGGGIQHYAYAFQWPVFAAFAIFLWVKTLIEEVRRDPDAAGGEHAGPAVTPVAALANRRGVRVGLTSQPSTVDAADDPDVAAWNARLAALGAAHAAAESRRR